MTRTIDVFIDDTQFGEPRVYVQLLYGGRIVAQEIIKEEDLQREGACFAIMRKLLEKMELPAWLKM